MTTTIGNFIYSEASTGQESDINLSTVIGVYKYSLACDIQTIQVEAILPQVAAPAFSPAGGVITQETIVAILCDTIGANIFYTLDGSDPQDPFSSRQAYSNPLTVTQAVTIRAIAEKAGMLSSAVSQASFLNSAERVEFPTIMPPGGSYSESQLVQITVATVGASIYYTTDGSAPMELPQYLYTVPFLVTESQNIRAIATKPFMLPSFESSVAYSIASVSKVALPNITPAGGTFAQPLVNDVTIGTTTVGATLYYTVDGSDPTASSLIYTGSPISIPQSLTLKVVGIKDGLANSDIVTVAFVIQATTLPSSFVAVNNSSDPYGTSARLTWEMLPVEGLTGFKIVYGLSTGNYTEQLIVNDPLARSFNVTGLTTNTNYFFALKALFGVLESPLTPESFCFVQDVVAPAAPTNFVATITADGKAVWLRWKNPTVDFSNVVLVKNTDHVPSSPTDGEVIYNGTLEEYYDRDI